MSLRYSSTILPIVAALFLLAGTGCESPSSSEGSLTVIQTDRELYDPTDQVRLSITNVTGRFLYYLCEGRVSMQELKDGTVVNSWPVHGRDVCNDTVTLDPATRTYFTLYLSSSDDVQEEARFTSEYRYRFIVELFSDPECTTLLPNESDRLSNEVAIVP